MSGALSVRDRRGRLTNFGYSALGVGAALGYSGIRQFSTDVGRIVRRYRPIGAPRFQRNIEAGTGGIPASGGLVQNLYNKFTAVAPPPRDTEMSAPKKQHYGDGGAGYTQIKYIKSKKGRKLRTNKLVDRLVRSSLNTVRFRFSNITDWNTSSHPNGSNYLTYGTAVNSGVLCDMPVYLVSLHGVNQSNRSDPSAVQPGNQGDPLAPNLRLVHRPMWKLVRDETAGVGNFFRWKRVLAESIVDGTTDTNCLEFEKIDTASGQGVNINNQPGSKAIGRKGLCLWTRLRLILYGKKNDPTRIRIRLIKFTDEDMCPEKYTYDDPQGVNLYTDNVTMNNNDIAEFWRTYCKPLISNPISSSIRQQQDRKFKVIETKIFDIQPTLSTESDTDGHQRVVDLFRRWGKICDFSAPFNGTVLAATDDKDGTTQRPQFGWQAQLADCTKGYYYLIDSMQPVRVDALPGLTSALTASFDFNLQSSWGTLADLV